MRMGCLSVPQLEPRVSEMVERITGSKPDLQAAAMDLVNPLGILVGSGAKYLRAAAPRLAEHMSKRPELFRMMENPVPFTNRPPGVRGLAWPKSAEHGDYLTAINPTSVDKGRTAIHEALHSLFFAKGGKGFPELWHSSPIWKRLEQLGARTGWGEPFNEMAARYQNVRPSGSTITMDDIARGQGEAAIEAMTDRILSRQAERMAKNPRVSGEYKRALERAGGP